MTIEAEREFAVAPAPALTAPCGAGGYGLLGWGWADLLGVMAEDLAGSPVPVPAPWLLLGALLPLLARPGPGSGPPLRGRGMGIGATALALAALALALAGCEGQPCMGSPAGCYDRSPATLALVAGAALIAGEGGGEEGEAEFRVRMAKSARLEALCAGIATRFRDRARLRAEAPEALALGRAEGLQTLPAPRQACVGLHAEALGGV